MRLFTPEPLLVPRETMEKCIIDGYEVQPETLVYVNPWGIARDPETWENPDEFWPERFLNSDVELKGQGFSLIPFGSRGRSCPGYSLGLLTVHLLLANLLNFFDWELPSGMNTDDIDTEAWPGLTLNKRDALKLVPRICVKSPM
ncbi:OLC1v1012787C1 [Oldenlandia corymbosa var. corymbosa]|uniref:OLC1v1012787C1 n=1 Tax=Oldenlandia corymbosa var. corymbosa TaxID=529605 RepID=A0AAV1E0A8_OLDCO|nr:OLC1v1012787C1 [Oldenlandia corymbosa var. corymbosa]